MLISMDVWEGSLDIDEPLLVGSHVSELIIRINDISGGLHKDKNFDAQWEQASIFPSRSLYFVYNPWVSGKINQQWLFDYMPKDAPHRVFSDVEVIYPGYSPDEYARQVQAYCDLVSGYGKETDIYTGEWFLPYLSRWPRKNYWWARYPSSLYPATSQVITWPDLIAKVEAAGYLPDPRSKCPGPIMTWQCTADRYKPPGCQGRVVDISENLMTLDDRMAYIGMPTYPYAKIPIPDYLRKVDAFMRTLGYTGPAPDV